MKCDKKHLRRTNYFRKIIAVFLSVLITFATVIGVFAFAFVSTTDIATPDEATPDEIVTQPMPMDIHIVTDKEWETVSPTTKSIEKPTEESNYITPTSNDEIENNNEEIKKKDNFNNEEQELEIADNNYYETASTDINTQFAGHYLIDIDNPDYSYKPQPIHLSNSDRELAARIVMGEYGNGGYTACCLIAQAMRDGMIRSNCNSISEVNRQYQYVGYNNYPNQNCYDAVDYIFELGSLAVPHRILFMYSTSMTYSSWHETQNFVVQYGAVRFFDAW